MPSQNDPVPVHLFEPVLDKNLAAPRFFNGRLLSGEVLTQSRDFERRQRQHLGRAVGAGVVEGLWVSGEGTPLLQVSAGLCINREGSTLNLPSAVQVALTERGPDGKVQQSAVFTDCDHLQSTGKNIVKGVYVLIVGPVNRPQGRAPVNSLAGSDVCCNVRDDVEGVQFRLAPIVAPDGDVIDTADPKRRSRVAHLCFGLDALHRDGRGLDPLPTCLPEPHGLTPAEVPLAVVAWTGAKVQFVDVWAARRFVAPAPAPDADSYFGDILGERQASLREAMFLQFQAHLGRDSSPTAEANFIWLPPAGMLGEQMWPNFLGAMAPAYARPVASAEDLRAVLRRGLLNDPIAVTTENPVPVDVYVSPLGGPVVYVRSTRGRLRIRVPKSAAPGSSSMIYARPCDPHEPNLPMRDLGPSAIRSPGAPSGGYYLYTLDLEPGVYRLRTHKLPRFEELVTVHGGITETFVIPDP